MFVRPRVLRHISSIITSRLSSDFACVRSTVDDVILRPLREADFDGIRELSQRAFKDEYKVDYLPAWLPKVLADPNRIACVAEKQGEIVAYMMLLGGVDDGHSLLFESGRSHPSVEGQGIMGRCFSVLLSEASRRWPDWESRRGTSIYTEYYDNNPSKINLLSKRCVYTVKITPSAALQQRLIREDMPYPLVSTISLSEDELCEFLKESTRTVFSDGIISIGYNMFKPIASNVPFIAYFHPNVFVNQDDRHGMSIGGGFPCDDGKAYKYNFSFFGRADANCCINHLFQHMKFCLKDTPDKVKHVYVVVNMPIAFRNSFPHDTFILLFQDLFGCEQKDVKMNTLYCFEYTS